MIFLSKKEDRIISIKKAGTSLLLAVILLFSISSLFQNRGLKRISELATTISKKEKLDESSNLRIIALKDAFSAFLERPILGWGAAASSSKYVQKTNTLLPQYREKGIFYLHFYYLEPLVDLGVIGFIIFLFFYLSIIKNLIGVNSTLSLNLFCFLIISPIPSIAMGTLFGYWYLFLSFLKSLKTTKSKSLKPF